MNKFLKNASPYLLILLGLLLLLYLNQPIPAGIFFLLGIVMILERIWPEEWESDKKVSDL